MSSWTLYFVLMLDSACCFIVIVAITSLAVAFALILAYSSTISKGYGDGKNIRGWLILACVMAALFVPLAILTPNTKQMAAILILPKIANNEQVQEIPGKLLDLADDWIEELKPEEK